jgi:hypothetical protein
MTGPRTAAAAQQGATQSFSASAINRRRSLAHDAGYAQRQMAISIEIGGAKQ